MPKIKLGVSQCLLGENVRYDGGHKRNLYITDTLGKYFDYLPLCPEVAIGMGIPREPIRLVQNHGNRSTVRAIGARSPELDVTDELIAYAQTSCNGLLPEVYGYIFQQGSPSCGMERVRIYRKNSKHIDHNGVGLFAAEVMRSFPLLPVEESGRLQDAALRENFLIRVFAYHDIKTRLLDSDSNSNFTALIQFYSEYKYLLMAHSLDAYRQIGHLLSNNPGVKLQETKTAFAQQFMLALRKPSTRKQHTNVLMHLQGYLKNHLDKQQKKGLGEVIESYRAGHIPLVVPVTLLNQLSTNIDLPYLKKQKYWQPYPSDLGLRNSG